MSDGERAVIGQRALVRRDLAMGQFFRAFDRARAALSVAPDDVALTLMQATALMRTGAVYEARAAVSRFDPTVDTLDAETPRPEHRALLDDAEAADMLGRIYRGSWRELGGVDDLTRARDLDLARFRRHGRLMEGAGAAVLCRTLHETERARELATAALTAARVPADADDDAQFYDHLAAAEASLLMGRTKEADRELSAAGAFARRAPERGVDARRRLSDLRVLGVAVPKALFAHFVPPTVVIFAGAPADRPDAETPVLPPGAEPALAEALDTMLAELDATIGYSSLAAGGDILFAEAMLRRGGEVNAVLPFEEADFIARRVAPAGARWADRYQALRKTVADLSPVCHDLYLGHDILLRFANQVIDGRARLRAAALDTEPTLVAAWDYLAEPSPGSPSDFIDHWGDPARLRIIDLAELRETASPLSEPPDDSDAAEEPPLPAHCPDQSVLAMLFADVVGYSTIQDQHLPAFWRYLDMVREHLGERLAPAIHVASWGDAIFIATPLAADLAAIALDLTAAFEETDARQWGLPARLRLRTGLHAGTAFIGQHPLSAERVLYGGAVNRAARIEPITVPGRIYASEQFVALLESEYSAAAVEARMTGASVPEPFNCRYRGELSLAKNYGRQAVYEISAPQHSLRPSSHVSHEDDAVTASLTMTLVNDIAEHARLSEALGAWAGEHGIDPGLVTTFDMAFDEIIANIVSYAYDDEDEHGIEVSCKWDGKTLSAEVADDGRPFDPLSLETPDINAPLEKRDVGGLGLFLVTELMDVIAYRRAGGKNHLSFAKHLADTAG